MAQTVLSAKRTILDRGVVKIQVTIPTTVDATGAVASFQLPKCFAIGFGAVGSNFNSKTVTLKGAPDGTNFVALPTPVAATATSIKSVAPADCGFLNYQVSISGAPSASIVVTLIGHEVL